MHTLVDAVLALLLLEIVAAEDALLLRGQGPRARVPQVVLSLAEADVAAQGASVAFWRG